MTRANPLVPVTAPAGDSVAVAETGEPAADRPLTPARSPLPAGWALPVAAVAVYVLDQASKHWALGALQDRVIDLVGSLRLNLAFNTGAAFSGGTGLGPVIAVAVILIVAGLVRWRHRVVHTALGTVAVGMIVGGALGNFSDRLLRAGDGLLGGAVVDFIDLQWWPVFNIADAAIVIGAIALVVESVRFGEPATP